jgi:hypothetical protein
LDKKFVCVSSTIWTQSLGAWNEKESMEFPKLMFERLKKNMEIREIASAKNDGKSQKCQLRRDTIFLLMHNGVSKTYICHCSNISACVADSEVFKYVWVDPHHPFVFTHSHFPPFSVPQLSSCVRPNQTRFR